MHDRIFIVIPAYNEEKNIGRVIGGLFEHGFKPISDGLTSSTSTSMARGAQIVVVDDGSTDRTGEIVRDLGVTVLRHEINRGQGAALQTGNEYAAAQGAEIVVHFDADGQFNPRDINPAVELLRREAVDIVLGSRFLDNRSAVPWTKKYIIFPLARVVNYLFTGLKLVDAQNGFRVLSRRALDKIRVFQDGMAHNSEILGQIKRHNLKFIEHPVQVIYNEYGLGVGGGVRIVWDLLKSKIL